MIAATSGNMFKAVIWRYSNDTAITTDVGICIARSAVRMRARKSGVVDKGVNWIECAR